MLTWILISAALFLCFLILIGFSISKKRKSLILLSLIPLGLSVIAGCVALWFMLSAGYRILSGKVDTVLKDRPGKELYSDRFGNSYNNCVSVINALDRKIPVVDCCTWLEFSTCGEEVRRILSQQDYQVSTITKEISPLTEPPAANKPAWFSPASLGDTILVYQLSAEKSQQRLYLSADSSRAFYYQYNY